MDISNKKYKVVIFNITEVTIYKNNENVMISACCTCLPSYNKDQALKLAISNYRENELE